MPLYLFIEGPSELLQGEWTAGTAGGDRSVRKLLRNPESEDDFWIKIILERSVILTPILNIF